MDEKPSTAKLALKWGAITGVAAIIYSTIINVAGLSTNPAFGYVSFFILIGGLIMGMREFKTLNAGYMSFGEGFGVGALTSTIVGMLNALYSVIYIKFIDGTIMEKQMEVTRERLEEAGNMTDEQIDQAMEMSKSFMSPGLMFLFGTLSFVLIGVIISLVVAAVLKKDKPAFE